MLQFVFSFIESMVKFVEFQADYKIDCANEYQGLDHDLIDSAIDNNYAQILEICEGG